MLNDPIISRLFADVSKYSSKVELFKNGAHLKEVFVLVAHVIKNFADNHGHNILRLFLCLTKCEIYYCLNIVAIEHLLPNCYNLGILNTCASYLNWIVTLLIHVKPLDACESYFAGGRRDKCAY